MSHIGIPGFNRAIGSGFQFPVYAHGDDSGFVAFTTCMETWVEFMALALARPNTCSFRHCERELINGSSLLSVSFIASKIKKKIRKFIKSTLGHSSGNTFQQHYSQCKYKASHT